MHCEQMAEQDKILAEKEMQITSLKAKIRELQIHSSPVQEVQNPDEFGISLLLKPQTVTAPEHQHQFSMRKSPQIEPYDGGKLDIRIDDWLPALHEPQSGMHGQKRNN